MVASLRTACVIRWLGSSLVGTPPPLKPQTMRQELPASSSSTMPMLAAGSSDTLRICDPAAVTRNFSPARLSSGDGSATQLDGVS